MLLLIAYNEEMKIRDKVAISSESDVRAAKILTKTLFMYCLQYGYNTKNVLKYFPKTYYETGIII